MFECGQCFRWNVNARGWSSYIGAAGGHAAYTFRLEHDGESCSLIIECTGGEKYWHSYFDSIRTAGDEFSRWQVFKLAKSMMCVTASDT